MPDYVGHPAGLRCSHCNCAFFRQGLTDNCLLYCAACGSVAPTDATSAELFTLRSAALAVIHELDMHTLSDAAGPLKRGSAAARLRKALGVEYLGCELPCCWVGFESEVSDG